MMNAGTILLEPNLGQNNLISHIFQKSNTIENIFG